VIDFDTRQRRPSRKEDVGKRAGVSDYLSSIGFYRPLVSAQDFGALTPLYELGAPSDNTIKHVQTETVADERVACYSMIPGIMHPRTGGYLAAPWEGGISYAIGVELPNMWGVPTLEGFS